MLGLQAEGLQVSPQKPAQGSGERWEVGFREPRDVERTGLLPAWLLSSYQEPETPMVL